MRRSPKSPSGPSREHNRNRRPASFARERTAPKRRRRFPCLPIENQKLQRKTRRQVREQFLNTGSSRSGFKMPQLERSQTISDTGARGVSHISAKKSLRTLHKPRHERRRSHPPSTRKRRRQHQSPRRELARRGSVYPSTRHLVHEHSIQRSFESRVEELHQRDGITTRQWPEWVGEFRLVQKEGGFGRSASGSFSIFFFKQNKTKKKSDADLCANR